jgi:predicted Zn-dependent protease
VRLLPKASGPQYKLAQARRAAGDEAGAEQALARFSELEAQERTADRGAKELGIALNEAQTLANENKLAEALARLDAIAADHPDDGRVLALRAKVLYSMGRRREAEIAIDDAVTRMPDRAEYQYLSGLFHMYGGRAAQAQAALERALAIDDGLATAHALLAGALVKQSKNQEALPHFDKAIELGADSPEVRLGYAEALKTLGRAKEAEAQMDAYRRLKSGSR